MKKWCASLLCFGLINLSLRSANCVSENEMLNQCSELKAQEQVDLHEVMGKWYVVEVMEHRGDLRHDTTGNSNDPPRLVVDACPIIKLRSIETRPPHEGPPRISLLWDEDAGTLEYTFWVSNSRGRGVWNADIIQNGTLADKPTYKQFVGTVHVMKAVASHMVLTFCTRSSEGQKFSVLLGREHKLTKNEVNGVHKLLHRRNVRVLNIRESCKNSAAIERPIIFVGIFATFVCAVLRNFLVN